MPITYTKLNSGAWGARSTVQLTPGQTITVTKRDGSTKTETVDKVVRSGNGTWLAALRRAETKSSQPPRRRERGIRTGCSCGSIEDNPRPSDCRSCRFENEDQ